MFVRIWLQTHCLDHEISICESHQHHDHNPGAHSDQSIPESQLLQTPEGCGAPGEGARTGSSGVFSPESVVEESPQEQETKEILILVTSLTCH